MSKHAPVLRPANVRGDKVMHERQQLIYIGSGRFSSAYRIADQNRVRLLTYHNDPSKDVVIAARENLDKPEVLAHFPNIVKVGTRKDYVIYEAGFYRRPILGKTKADRDGKYTVGVKGTRLERDIHMLKHAQKIAQKAYPYAFTRRSQLLNFNKIVVAQADVLRVTVTVIDAIEALMYAAGSMEQWIMFDSFRPSNMGVDRFGRLVLVDPMFDYHLLQQHLTTRRVIKRAA